MTAFILSLVIVGCIILLIKLLLPEPRKTKKKRLARKVREASAARQVPAKKTTAPPQSKIKGLDIESPEHMRIFADEVTKRSPDLTARVVKKWLREK